MSTESSSHLGSASGVSLPAPRIGPPPPLERSWIDTLVRTALAEDVGPPGERPWSHLPDDESPVRGSVGDLTARGIPGDRRARARLVSKASGRLAGLGVFTRTFELCDPDCSIREHLEDGAVLEPGTLVCEVEGNARALLLAERTALNFIQRMSGTATAAAHYVDATGGRARVLDTRKTTPGLRMLEKYAVRCGGGENHRIGLFDEVMVKDNHLDMAGKGLAELVADLRGQVGPSVRITAESRNAEEALAGVAGGADVVMLDNMSVEAMSELCPRLRAAAEERGRPVEVEASGGITLETIGAVAGSGVDRISVGALTHSAPALDLSLYLEPVP